MRANGTGDPLVLALRSSRSFIINHIVIDAVQQFLICPNKQSNKNVGGPRRRGREYRELPLLREIFAFIACLPPADSTRGEVVARRCLLASSPEPRVRRGRRSLPCRPRLRSTDRQSAAPPPRVASARVAS